MKKTLAILFLAFSSSLLTLSAQTKTETATTTNTGTPATAPYYGPKGCPSAMPDEEFKTVNKTVSDETDVDNVIVIAKKEATAHCYSVEQVKNILKLLKTDENRFEFFKVVYPHIYDQNNYSHAGDSFKDAAYKDKIRIYVNSLE
ncbi:MAG TPA: DUF4476 domain-containing protein [Bacteroidia bacterium]|jgi:hypothetical protein|nr:DUF4476 domain-containing protein [Bacteroidia bacterium]